jgi:hypothetical protein
MSQRKAAAHYQMHRGTIKNKMENSWQRLGELFLKRYHDLAVRFAENIQGPKP